MNMQPVQELLDTAAARHSSVLRKAVLWLKRFVVPSRRVTLGCNENGDNSKDPRGCWNVHCQLGATCCRSVAGSTGTQK